MGVGGECVNIIKRKVEDMIVVNSIEYNHYIKKTILKKWLIDGKYHYFDIQNNDIKILGKNQSSKQFTSFLITQAIEKRINTNKIERDFESAINKLLNFQQNLNAHQKMSSEKLEERKEKYAQKVLRTSLDYIALQLTRDPNNIYKYFEEYEEQIKRLPLYHLISEEDKKLLLASRYQSFFHDDLEAYKILFDIQKNKIKQGHEFIILKNEKPIFHLSETNTISLLELLDKYIKKFNPETIEFFSHCYITVLSPTQLLLVNCNVLEINKNCSGYKQFLDNIENLWADITLKNNFGKIILANIEDNTINYFKNKNKEVTISPLLGIFQLNQNIYKTYFLEDR